MQYDESDDDGAAAAEPENSGRLSCCRSGFICIWLFRSEKEEPVKQQSVLGQTASASVADKKTPQTIRL